MQVLRDREEQLDVSAHVRRLAALARRGEPLSFLVELGVLEQAIADHEAPREDRLGPIERALGAAALAAGHACLGEIAGCARALAILERIAPRLPRSALARSPEGFLHYALDPMAYAAAARAYACEVGDRQAREALVIGIRSIGTSLSAVVAAAIGARARVTLRPRGPSGARALSVTAALARAIGAHRADVLVVDEGPGVTGETFEVVARWLVSLGIEPAHVRLVPSHSRIPELAPAPRRSFLASLRSHPPAPFDPRPARVAAALGLELSLDLGEGRWRAFTGARAPSRGIFERKKLLASGRRRALLRWAGLGEHAERALELASGLAACGVCAAPIDLREGFAIHPWIEGAPASRGAPDRTLMAAMSRYLAARAPLTGTGQAVEREPLIAMLDENAREAGLDPSAAIALLSSLPEDEAVIADGRLAPWEWLQRGERWMKVDTTDGDGVHLPGPVDAAWDLAGAWIEHQLDERAASELALGSLGAARALLAPYAALALGDATVCARAAHPSERAIFASEIALYRRALERAISRARALVPTPARSIPASAGQPR